MKEGAEFLTCLPLQPEFIIFNHLFVMTIARKGFFVVKVFSPIYPSWKTFYVGYVRHGKIFYKMMVNVNVGEQPLSHRLFLTKHYDSIHAK